MNLRSIIVLFAVSLATAASAQPVDPAEQAYREGRKAYDLREWDKAIAAFKEAYRLSSDARSLFNIAQAYRLKGDCVEAVGFYKTYKRNYPNAPNIAIVDKFIADLEPCANERAKPPAADTTTPAPTTPPPQPTTPVVTTPPTTPMQPMDTEAPVVIDRGKTKRTIGLAAGGAGVVLVATGFVFGALAQSKADAVMSGGDPSNPPEFDPALDEQGRRYDTLAKITWIAGGALVIGGGALYMLGRSERTMHLSVATTRGGAMFVVAGGF